MLANTSAALSGLAWTISRPAAAWTATTLMLWATTSCISRAIRLRSLSTARSRFGDAVGLGLCGAALGVDEDPLAIADDHPGADRRDRKPDMLRAVR